MGVYEKMVKYYDLIYGDYYDLDIFLQEARKADGPVLEVACGTGRIMLTLLQEGIDITGIDLSEAMLDELRRKAKDVGVKPEVYQADMRDFRLKRRFKLIIIPYRSFSHLLNDEDRKKALLTFKEHLDDGGKLVINLYIPTSEDLGTTGRFHHLDTYMLETPEGAPYELGWYLHYEPEGNLARYRVVLSIGKEKHTFTMDTAYIFPDKIRSLLKECGYRNIQPHGDVEKEGEDIFWFAEK